jgi:transposase InsO family protein
MDVPFLLSTVQIRRIERRFHAPAPNRLWVSDFTYVSTCSGFAYVAFVIDVYARYIVDWRVAAMRIMLEPLLHQQGEALHALPHIRVAERDPHPRAGTDHRKAFSGAATSVGDTAG